METIPVSPVKLGPKTDPPVSTLDEASAIDMAEYRSILTDQFETSSGPEPSASFAQAVFAVIKPSDSHREGLDMGVDVIGNEWPSSGRGVLVTGAASGIGRAIAERFVANGDHVVGLDLNRQPMEGLGLAAVLEGDASRPDILSDAIIATERQSGRLDVIVPCAGMGAIGSIIDLDIELWDKIFALNVRQTYLAAKYGVPLMKKTGGGVIIPIASQLGVVSVPGLTAYSASKGGLIQLTRALALELGADHIRVNAVCPGPTDTPLFRDAIVTEAAARQMEQALNKTVFKRLLHPREISDAVFFLASPGATAITGEALMVDAGYTLS